MDSQNDDKSRIRRELEQLINMYDELLQTFDTIPAPVSNPKRRNVCCPLIKKYSV